MSDCNCRKDRNDCVCLNGYNSQGREKMDFEHHNAGTASNDDRLSGLPDELIHKILSYIDTKYAVQTSSLSSRWKVLWTSMPCLNLYSGSFSSLLKFSKFIRHVLSRRNRQTQLSSVTLDFNGADSQFFARKTVNYAYAHNVQKLLICTSPSIHHEFPLFLFSSRSLERLTLRTYFRGPFITPNSPWDFPSLTTLHLSEVTLCDEITNKSIDLFSKCVNLKNLTLIRFFITDVEVLDIITPKLVNFTLIECWRCPEVVNLVAPELRNLIIEHCSIKYMNVPPGLSALFYRNKRPLHFSTNDLNSLEKVTLDLRFYMPEEQYAFETINMLQELHNAQFLTLNTDIVVCLSSFPDLLSHYPSPFNNLKCLKIDSSRMHDAYKISMSIQVKNFLLENSPNATFIIE